MLICDWCGEPIHDGEVIAILKVEFRTHSTAEDTHEYRPPRTGIRDWQRFHEICGIKAFYESTEAIEDIPGKDRPDPSDETIMYHTPTLDERRNGPDGPSVSRLNLFRHLDQRARGPWQALREVGIDTLLDVSFRTRAEIAAIPGVGAGTVRKLEALLEEHGMRYTPEQVADRSKKAVA